MLRQPRSVYEEDGVDAGRGENKVMEETRSGDPLGIFNEVRQEQMGVHSLSTCVKGF